MHIGIMKWKINEKAIVLGILVFISIIVILTQVSFLPDTTLLDRESYTHAKAANILMENNLSITAQVSKEELSYNTLPYQYLLALIGLLTGVEIASLLVPWLGSIATIILLYLLLKSQQVNPNFRILSISLLALSPAFLYNTLVSQPYSLIIPLYLSSLYLLTRKNNKSKLGLVLGGVSAFFDPFLFIILAIPAAFFIRGKNTLIMPKTFIFTIIFGMLMFITRIYTFKLYNANTPTGEFLVDNLNLFGSLIGFSVFSIILAFNGLITTWKQKQANYPFYILIILLIFSSAVFPAHKIALNLIICVLAAIGMLSFLSMKWELKTIGQITIGILLIGLLFSAGIYINNLIKASPDARTIKTLEFLKTNSLENEKVISHSLNKPWIEYFADRKALSTNNQSLFRTRKEDEAMSYLKRNDINYIFVDQKTRELMITPENNLGLEFIMQNSQNFKKMVQYGEVTLWARSE